MNRPSRITSFSTFSAKRNNSGSTRIAGYIRWIVIPFLIICLLLIPTTGLAQIQLGNDSNGPDSGQVRVYDLSNLTDFEMTAGFNDAWYNPTTSGQGFFITVFPDLGFVSLAWFTYDTELPPPDATANLGDPGHRWLTAVGPLVDNKAVMNIEMTSGGIFDSGTEITRTDPHGSDGTIILTFYSCNSGTAEYDIPSISWQGIVPIQRVANDNIVICEVLNAD